MIPKTAQEAYLMGYLDYSAEFLDDVTGPDTVIRKGHFEFEVDGVKGAPLLKVPFTAHITFGMPRRVVVRSPRNAKRIRNASKCNREVLELEALFRLDVSKTLPAEQQPKGEN